MDLLDEGKKKKNEKSKAQKIVLTLLILSIIICIAIVIIFVYLQKKPVKKELSIEINGQEYRSEDLELIELEDGNKLIPIKVLCSILGYDYFNGEYNTTLEDKDKCYINTGINIVQVYNDSNRIFKTEEISNKDYEKYDLNNNITTFNNALYINLNDINIAFNLVESYIENENKTVIQTPKFWIEQNKKDFEENGYIIDGEKQNEKSLAYGFIIVKNNDKYGILDLDKKEIIGTKYNSIEFIEYTKNFLVSNNSQKYGIIDINGTIKIKISFDELALINYDPLLYLVKNEEAVGICKEDGTIINEIKYSSIGYPEDKKNNIIYTLIIPEINANIPRSIVVCKDNKYGLISLEDGKEIIPCSLKGIFLYNDVEKDLKDYVVQYENNTYSTLENHVAAMNSITVNINE